MHKWVLSLLLLLFFHQRGDGQSRLDVGVSLAPSIERQLWLGTKDWFKFHDRPSLNFGGIVRIHAIEKLNISTGLWIYDKGSFFRLASINPPYTTPITTTHNFHSWYITLPITLSYDIRLKKGSIIYPSLGLAYGRVVWKYTIKRFANERVYHNRYYDSTNENYWGVNLGIGMEYQLKEGASISVRPNYFRQLNRGWDLNAEETNQGRHDSFVVDFMILYDWDILFGDGAAEEIP